MEPRGKGKKGKCRRPRGAPAQTPRPWQCHTPGAAVTEGWLWAGLGAVSSAGGLGPGWLGGGWEALAARLEVTRLLLHLG